MAHQSLYRRYRPQRFSEVRGQEQVVNALRSAVADGRVGHAYLFSGPRGTGKTSTARILAKALNCEDLQGGEPCGVCAACTAMQAGTSYDLQELDAASNNKVEDVRSLVERVALGSPGRTKVYILDEVHMLSTGASNALLKTLEEPPDHVVFVLATTDPQKVLPTIRSRTQHYEFHLLPADELADHVRWVISDAGLQVDDSAVEHVLRAGGGSARDTLSALDQAAAGGVSDAGDHAEALVEAVVAGDTGAALSAVATATAAGRDPRVLGESLLAQLRDVFLHRMGGPQEHLSDTARAQVAAWAGRVTDRAVTRALEEVGEALLGMRQAPDPRIPLEVALVRVTRAAPVDTGGHPELADLVARIERLEQGGVPASTPAPRPPAPDVPPPTASAAGPAPGDDGPPATGGSTPNGEPRPGTGAAGPGPGAAPAGVEPRGAERARAALAGRGAAPARTSPSAPSPPAAPPPPPSPPAAPAPAGSAERSADGPPLDRAQAPGSGPVEAAPAPVPGPPAGDPPSSGPGGSEPDAPAPPSSGAATPGAAGPTEAMVDQVGRAWVDQVVPGLKGLAKALFQAGNVLDADDATVTVGLPDAVHRERCEQKRGDAEAALASALGRPVRLVLAVGGAGAAPAAGGSRPAGAAPGSAPATGPEPPDEVDLDELVDAPLDKRGGVERVTEAFPGARIVEER
ncbi:MAG TPA: DNA polymerase III subunit gamma/tau [Acidimicrobiales bacterium]|nr:DNA polymerase III subunit gamma/tau [Acidimicrobiales bacterium]